MKLRLVATFQTALDDPRLQEQLQKHGPEVYDLVQKTLLRKVGPKRFTDREKYKMILTEFEWYGRKEFEVEVEEDGRGGIPEFFVIPKIGIAYLLGQLPELLVSINTLSINLDGTVRLLVSQLVSEIESLGGQFKSCQDPVRGKELVRTIRTTFQALCEVWLKNNPRGKKLV